MLEKLIQHKIIDYLDKVSRCTVLKTMLLNKRGYPDLIVCYLGRFVYIEVKKEGASRPTRLQVARMNELDTAGARGFVAYGYDDFLIKWSIITKEIQGELLYA